MPRDGVRGAKLVGGTRVLVKNNLTLVAGATGSWLLGKTGRWEGTIVLVLPKEMSIGYGGTAAKYYYLLNFYKDLSKIQNRITLHLDSLKESSTGDNSP
jgi:hypothetical protein